MFKKLLIIILLNIPPCFSSFDYQELYERSERNNYKSTQQALQTSNYHTYKSTKQTIKNSELAQHEIYKVYLKYKNRYIFSE